MKAGAKTSETGVVKGTRRLLPGLSVKDGFTRHPFDAEYGVRTSGLVAGRHLKSGHRHDRHATAYYGVAPSVLRALVNRWRRTGPKTGPAAVIAETTFVDVGAGMGRAVLLASEFGFKAAVGVELHPALAAIARKNLRIWRAAGRERAPMRIVERDAVVFDLPVGPVLVFLFNPFGAPVLRRLLKGWSKRGSGLDLLYVNNEQESVLESEHGWTRLFLGKIRRSKGDAIADYKIMANQPEGEYASANYEDCSIWRKGIKPGTED